MITVAEAIQIITAQTRPLEPERICLADALGRILAEDVIADSDLPPLSYVTLREIRAIEDWRFPGEFALNATVVAIVNVAL